MFIILTENFKWLETFFISNFGDAMQNMIM